MGLSRSQLHVLSDVTTTWCLWSSCRTVDEDVRVDWSEGGLEEDIVILGRIPVLCAGGGFGHFALVAGSEVSGGLSERRRGGRGRGCWSS